MAPSFFFSYARFDWDKDPGGNIHRFFEDLNAFVTVLGENEGFFDSHGIDAGDNWKLTLQDALRTAPVLVAMYSPRYFMSRYCVWEWNTVFEPYQSALDNREAMASPIVPVRWLSAGLSIEAPYDTFQYGEQEFPRNVEDLSQFMSVKKNGEKYNLFVRRFGTALVAKIRAAGRADRFVGDVPPPGEPAAPVAGRPETGAQYVRCVFVTGLRHQIVAPRLFRDCYGQDPARKDWRPCFPNEDRVVSEIIEEVATREGRVVRYLQPGRTLLSQLRQAEQHNNVIVIVVDPWSLNIAEWHQFVTDFDTSLLRNCGVLVIWNKDDPDIEAGKKAFSPVIREMFSRHLDMTNMFFRESVTTITELQKAIVDAFHKVRTNLISGGKGAAIEEGMSEGQPSVSN